MFIVRRLLWGVSAVVVALVLASCSTNGAILLHNGAGVTVEIRLGKSLYTISAGETQEVRIDPVFGNQPFSVRTTTATHCYVMRKVDPRWLKPGFRYAKVLGLLDANGKIYLFPPESNEDDFYKSALPTQPADFPLEPIAGESC